MERTIGGVCYRASVLGITEDKRKTAGGQWTTQEIEILKKYFSIEKYTIINRLPGRSKISIRGQANRLGLLQKKKRKIICIETQDIYDSIISAQKAIGVTDINSCLSGRQSTVGGYHWAYLDDEVKIQELSEFIGRPKSEFYATRKVLCVETGVMYESVKAAEDFGGSSVWNCLKGISKTAGGYHWEYVE